MKLYTENYPAPNPRKVHIYLAEKGIAVERVHTKMMERMHKAADFLAKNSLAGAMKWLDKELSGGGQYLVGDYFSMADIVLLCGIDFGRFIHQQIPDDCPHLLAWHARASARPSAKAEGVAGAAPLKI